MMTIKDMLTGKKQWHALMARVKALPKDYQIVYKEMQKYIFKVGPVENVDGMKLLTDLIDLFETSAQSGKSVLEITGDDVAAFADGLIKNVTNGPTYANLTEKAVNHAVAKAMKKALK